MGAVAFEVRVPDLFAAVAAVHVVDVAGELDVGDTVVGVLKRVGEGTINGGGAGEDAGEGESEDKVAVRLTLVTANAFEVADIDAVAIEGQVVVAGQGGVCGQHAG